MPQRHLRQLRLLWPLRPLRIGRPLYIFMEPLNRKYQWIVLKSSPQKLGLKSEEIVARYSVERIILSLRPFYSLTLISFLDF